MPAKIRIFIALRATNDLKETIARWVEKNKKDFPLVRWLDPDNWHITLIPPWYEDEPGLEKLKNALTSVAGTVKPFDINFTNISFGPTKKEPRLIWASGEAPPQLIRLKQELEEALNQPSEKREFLLHLTVARFRPEKRSLRLNVAASGNRGVQPQVSMHLTDLNETIAWPETVSEYQLMRSDLHPDGARYTILQSYAV